MMVVITVSNCPQKLRGDLTRWLMEIDTGVFVGNLNARVRDAVWDRVCEHIKNGHASMAFSTNNEQKLDFRIHNTAWKPVDFDGIQLVCRTLDAPVKEKQLSKPEIWHMNRISQMNRKPSKEGDSYVVIDIETTGLQDDDEIIELGAIHIVNGEIQDSYSVLVQCSAPISDEIQKLTGITNEEVQNQGIPLKTALSQFLTFCGDNELIGYNLRFDMQFLQRVCAQSGFPSIKNKTTDVMKIAKKKLDLDSGYSLSSVAGYLEIEQEKRHRALADCMLTYWVFEKLKEI